MKKRILACLLALVMLIGVLGPALAEFWQSSNCVDGMAKVAVKALMTQSKPGGCERRRYHPLGKGTYCGNAVCGKVNPELACRQEPDI